MNEPIAYAQAATAEAAVNMAIGAYEWAQAKSRYMSGAEFIAELANRGWAVTPITQREGEDDE